MNLFRIFLIGIFTGFVAVSGVLAEASSLFRTDTFGTAGPSLLQARQDTASDIGAPSLFIGKAGQSFFAPFPKRQPVSPHFTGAAPLPPGVAGLRRIIGHAESRRDGYDAVQHGARIRPDKTPTDMTIGEIYNWIAATPGQPHAIGRYQFIPATLRRVVKQVGYNRSTLFSPHVQDQLADVLLAEAGMQKFTRGLIGRHQFMNNLAKVWAGLPTSNGRSYYDGYAGNKASMTWADFDDQMRHVFDG